MGSHGTEAGSSGTPVHSARLGLASVCLWMLAACRREMKAEHRCGWTDLSNLSSRKRICFFFFITCLFVPPSKLKSKVETQHTFVCGIDAEMNVPPWLLPSWFQLSVIWIWVCTSHGEVSVQCVYVCVSDPLFVEFNVAFSLQPLKE